MYNSVVLLLKYTEENIVYFGVPRFLRGWCAGNYVQWGGASSTCAYIAAISED
jgi:hypothetical protein